MPEQCVVLKVNIVGGLVIGDSVVNIVRDSVVVGRVVIISLGPY